MDVKITKWGNSLGIRIPKSLLDDLQIKEGDTMSIETRNKEIVLKMNQYREFNIKDYAEKYYGKPFKKLENVIAEKELDWGDTVGDEAW